VEYLFHQYGRWNCYSSDLRHRLIGGIRIPVALFLKQGLQLSAAIQLAFITIAARGAKMDAEGSATGAETDDAAPAVSQHALQLQMAFRRLNSRGSRWNGAYSGKQGMPVADFVQHG